MAKFSQDTKIDDLLKDPTATAILEEYKPGIATNPQTKMVFGMTLKEICSFPQAGINVFELKEIDVKLRAIE